MATTFPWEAATSRSTGISATTLADGANLLSSEIDNGTNLDDMLALELRFTSDPAPSAYKPVEVYLIMDLTSADYDDGDATPTDPAGLPVASFLARNITAAQSPQSPYHIPIPPFPFKLLLKSELGVAATAVTLKAYTYKREAVTT